MRKVTIPLLLTLALVGCEKTTNLQAPTLAFVDVKERYDTPIFLSTEKEIIVNEIQNPNEDTIKFITEPNDLLVVVNKTNTLPADYIPEDLVKPNIPFYFTEDIPKRYLREEAAIAVEELFEDALINDIKLIGVSGYRSYDRQEEIFNTYVKNEGYENAIKFSALPGQSEHQTGLALDVSISDLKFKLEENFGETKEGIWLTENAHKHGFIIRYLKGKEHLTGYNYEPWHIRYVGIEAATEIYKNDMILEQYRPPKRQKVIHIVN